MRGYHVAVATLRRATPRDALAIAELHAASWRQTYAGMLPDEFLAHEVSRNRMALWKARFARPAATRDYIVVAVEQRRVAGFVCLIQNAGAFGPLVDNLHVREISKGKRIGSRLLASAAREALRTSTRMHLWVLEANTAARAFYESRGGTARDKREEELVPDAIVTELRYVWEGDALRALANEKEPASPADAGSRTGSVEETGDGGATRARS